MSKTNNLSDAARGVLGAAAIREDHLALPPETLPVAARRAVVSSLLKAGLLEEIPTDDEHPAWRTAETGERFALRATTAGLAAIGVTSDEAEAGPSEPAGSAEPAGSQAEARSTMTPIAPAQDAVAVAQRRLPLRAAARALLAAWDATANGPPWLATHFDTLRAAVAPTAHAVGARQPRPDTKRAVVLALLRRSEGVTIAQVAEVTGWATHTVRGFFAGLKKAGLPVQVLERVKQVGSGKQGAKGSYTVYRIGEAA